MSASSSQGTDTGSTQSFVTALVLGLIIFGAEMAVFVWFHRKQKKVYQPRTFLAPPSKRVPELPANPIQWFTSIFKHQKEDILRLNGFDAYTFSRYLSLLLKIFVPTWFFTWAVLFPLTAVSPTSGQNGLSIFTFGNVATSEQDRYAGHLILAWFITFWILYLIWRELKTFQRMRHQFLSDPRYAHQNHARTVLVTHVPEHLMTEPAMRELASPHEVEKVWLIRDVSDVNEVFDERQQACTKLEGAVGSVLGLAAKRIRKGKASAPEAGKADPESGDSALLNSIITEKKRPTHKLGKVPCCGTKVDTLEHCTETIREDNEKLVQLRAKEEDYKLATSAILRFNTQAAAISFAQDLPKIKAKQVGPRYVDFQPETIQWKNLGLNSKLLPPKKALSWALTIGLIMIWTIPVAFCGSLSNLSSLCESVPWLSWLCELPSPVVGIIQGAAPPVALAVLFILLPIVLRIFSTMEGIPLITQIDLSVASKYWIFLAIHGFLVVTLSGALTSALPAAIQNPGDAPSLLANTLPKASIFFLTYLITTGLSAAAASLSQAVPVVLFYVFRWLGGTAPRKIWNLEKTLPSTTFFQAWPNVDLLVILAIVYSVIQPIINGLAVVAFGLYWISYKYLFIWVLDQPQWRETGGLWFIKAIKHIFVGLYIEEICLIGLFFLASDANGNRSCIPQGALMIVLLIFTAAFQIYIDWVWKPAKLNAALLNDTPPAGSKGHPYVIEGIENTETRASGSDPLIGNADQPYPGDYRPSEDGTHTETLVPDSFTQHDGAASPNGKAASLPQSASAVSPNEKAGALPQSSREDLNGHANVSEKNAMKSDEADAETGQSDEDKYGFLPPSMWKPQPPIWIADDKYGLGRIETNRINAAGVKASCEGASMNEKGRVEVSRQPPGMPDPLQDK